MKYFDPILYAHNYGIDLVLSEQVKPGYNAYSDEVATDILRKWARCHRENLIVMEEYAL